MSVFRILLITSIVFIANSTGFAIDPALLRPFATESSAVSQSGLNDFEIVYRGLPSILPRQSGGMRIWGDFYYANSDVSPQSAPDYDAKQLGLMIGLDLKRSNGNVLGIYYHYGNNDFNWNNKEIKGSVNNHQLGISYLKNLPLSHILINAFGGVDNYGINCFDIEKINADGYQGGVYGEFGMDIPFGMFGFKPYLGLHYHFFDHDQFAFNSRSGWDSENYHGLNNLLGMRVNMKFFQGMFSTQFRATWIHEYMGESPTSLSYFGSIQGCYSTPIAWNFEGNTARDWAWIGAGLKFSLGSRLMVFADYDLMVNSRQTTHIGSLCLCIGW